MTIIFGKIRGRFQSQIKVLPAMVIKLLPAPCRHLAANRVPKSLRKAKPMVESSATTNPTSIGNVCPALQKSNKGSKSKESKVGPKWGPGSPARDLPTFRQIVQKNGQVSTRPTNCTLVRGKKNSILDFAPRKSFTFTNLPPLPPQTKAGYGPDASME